VPNGKFTSRGCYMPCQWVGRRGIPPTLTRFNPPPTFTCGEGSQKTTDTGDVTGRNRNIVWRYPSGHLGHGCSCTSWPNSDVSASWWWALWTHVLVQHVSQPSPSVRIISGFKQIFCMLCVYIFSGPYVNINYDFICSYAPEACLYCFACQHGQSCELACAFIRGQLIFRRVCKNYEKRQLASTCLYTSVCLSA
jgi:hypothetical protein